MPTYTYRCKACPVTIVRVEKMSETGPSVPCPVCDAVCNKVLQATPAIFKTTGFPGNDMKELHSGSSRGGFTVGRKPTHANLDQVERDYPGSDIPKSYEHGDM